MKPIVAPKEQQPTSFAFKDMTKVADILSRYPEERKQSAVMPLLDLVMRETEGQWIPEVAMEEIAKILEMPRIKVFEVATFYSMFILRPIGKNHIQCCTTTPCWLRGSADIVKACEEKLGIHIGETTSDGKFTLTEVECLGACVNAPMVQINDSYYEDLTPERMKEIIDALSAGREVPAGPQNGRKCSMAITGPTTLQDEAKKAGVA
ncbi:MAG: NADH-quinone oxidoreductase subunit NuoE [Proteobacteria bacterium]|nr:NADH-quinone oxidoreductase subunit NuoE [Pseudomonadota bacterium]